MRRRGRFPGSTILVVFLGLVVVPSAPARPRDGLLDPRLGDLFHEALSGELAKEHVIAITRHHRIQGSRGYRAAAQYVLDQLRSFGFDERDAYIESFPSDGRIVYQTWQSPSGWDIEWAELRMIEPYAERLVGYPEVAMSVITYSNPGDVTAELVWVGEGTHDEDYRGKDVRGKFVLATGYGGAVHRLAVLKYGAAAVVCYLDDARAMEHPDMLQYTGMWPRTEELDRVTFGFNITHRQGEKLRRLLAAGKKVVLRGVVKGIGLEPYFMDVVVAHIRGTDPEAGELVYSAHLDHPKESANDNASGSGALLDMARTLKVLIDSGRLPRPRRSIRFLWVPEFFGTMAYVDKHPELRGPERGGRFLANLNLDMVGEHLEKIHSRMILTRTPASLPSVLNDVVAEMAAQADRIPFRTPRGSHSVFNYRVTPYSSGSDHVVFIDLKIPGMMLGHSPDYTHHTSEDTPDKVDPVELERSEWIAVSSFWYLANLTEDQAVDLAYRAGARRMARLGEAGAKALRMVRDAQRDRLPGAWAEAENLLDHVLQWEQQALASILYFQNGARVRNVVTELQAQLRAYARFLRDRLRRAVRARGYTGRRPPAGTPIDGRVPVRLTRGPIASDYLERHLTEDQRAWYRTEGRALTGNVRFEIVNFVDGRRTVTDIRNAVSAEYGPIPTPVVAHYLEDLVRVGVVRWK